jgi:hypothetical protein
VDVTFPKQNVLLALEFDLKAIFGVEQDGVADLDRPDVWTDGNGVSPGQPLGQLRSRRNQNPCTRPTLAFALGNLHEHSIEQDGDGELVDHVRTVAQ